MMIDPTEVSLMVIDSIKVTIKKQKSMEALDKLRTYATDSRRWQLVKKAIIDIYEILQLVKKG